MATVSDFGTPSIARSVIAYSILAEIISVDTSLTVGALAARLAQFNVQTMAVTNMAKNNWSLWVACKAYLLSVALEHERLQWIDCERSATVRAGGGGLPMTGDFYATALLLESRLRARLQAAETRLSIVRVKSTPLTLSSLEARRKALKVKDPTIDAHFRSKPVGAELALLSVPCAATTVSTISAPSTKRASTAAANKAKSEAKKKRRGETAEKASRLTSRGLCSSSAAIASVASSSSSSDAVAPPVE